MTHKATQTTPSREGEAPDAGFERRVRNAQWHFVWVSVLITVVSPVVLVLKAISFVRRRPFRHYDPLRWSMAKYGTAPLLSPGEKPSTSGSDRVAQAGEPIRVVYMAASFGEAAMAERFHRLLEKKHPDVQAIWTIRNRQELDYLIEKNPDRNHLLWPFDYFVPVRRWLRKARPDVVVLLEKFWFGSLVVGSAAAGARVVALNGRTNPQTSLFKRIASPHYAWVLQAMEAICLQGEEFRKCLGSLLPESVKASVTGNVKMDLPLPALSPEKAASLRDWVFSGPSKAVLVAGSTDSLEEDRFVTEAFLEVRKSAACTLMIAPRRLARCDELIEYWESVGLKASRRSAPQSGADVLLLDTLGELAHVFGSATGAFIGGTLIGAGHNIIEPLQSGVPVAYGPCRDHFEELQLRCESVGVGFRVTEPSQLAAHWSQMIQDPALREEIGRKAAEMLDADRGAFDANLDALVDAVEAVKARRSRPF